MQRQSGTTDVLIIGGGIIGICLALGARRRWPDQRVTLIEKEPECGLHASGRNSGVLHAGFYYTADSLKARFTREGNARLAAYCDERGLPILRCGKLVVARNEAEHEGLDELLRRGRLNGVEVHDIDEAEARRIEPRVRTAGRALWSPATSVVDPAAVVASLARDAAEAGVAVRTGVAYQSTRRGVVETSAGTISAGYAVNAAGLFADRVARAYGFSEHYRILPFKGVYLVSHEPAARIATNIYPVPRLGNPWLGVHLTPNVHGYVKIGPTAIPAFWREHYRGLSGFRLNELVEILGREAGLFLRDDFGFRRVALEEIRKYSRRHILRLAAELADGIEPRHFRGWSRPGIRAQLLDLRDHSLEMDFRYEGDDRSFHVLNAVSPAFTCALPFTEFLLERIEQLRG